MNAAKQMMTMVITIISVATTAIVGSTSARTEQNRLFPDWQILVEQWPSVAYNTSRNITHCFTTS